MTRVGSAHLACLHRKYPADMRPNFPGFQIKSIGFPAENRKLPVKLFSQIPGYTADRTHGVCNHSLPGGKS